MSKVKIQGNASGTGTLTIAAPNTNTDRSLTLPDTAGEIVTNNYTGDIDVTGTVTTDGLTIDGSGTKYLSVGSTDGSGAYIYLDGSSNGDFLGGDYSVIKNENNDLVFISGTPNGDIDSFTHDGSGNKLRHKIGSNGDISFYEDTGTTAKLFWDASAESLGIGTSSPDSALHIGGADSASDGFRMKNTAGESVEFYYASSAADADFIVNRTGSGAADIGLKHTGDVYFTSGNVGIGTSSPTSKLDCGATSNNSWVINARTNGNSKVSLGVNSDYGARLAGPSDVTGAVVSFGEISVSDGSSYTERMRIDSSGNLLVGMSTYSASTGGVRLRQDGESNFNRDGQPPLLLNRLTSDGDIAKFYKDGSTVGSIGTYGGAVYIASPDGGDAGLRLGNEIVVPVTTTGALRDNAIDLGIAASRFDDIYATNGTIQTSDQNDKQQIASLTDAEMNVAKRLSALFKTFKWNSSVEENGDNARTHTGIIAQDMQQAFTDEGLNAGNYAMFISSTWWEKEISVDAVEAVEGVEATYDEEGNELTPAVEAVEAQDAYTYMDTKEEATEGYTERTRLGVRYPELFAFINAYNDQRFSNLEDRLTALESA